MENFANGYYRICIWITRFVYVNLLWIAFSVAGLVVFGAFPATIAMFAVVRKWVMGESEVMIFRTFWKTFKSEFLKGNLLGYSLFIIGYILYLDLQYVRLQDGLLFHILTLLIIGLIFLYFIILLYIFPLYVHFETKTFHYLKWSLVIGITHPILTVIMVAGLVVVYYIVSSAIPGLIVFLLGSFSAYVLMWCSYRTFPAQSKTTVQT